MEVTLFQQIHLSFPHEIIFYSMPAIQVLQFGQLTKCHLVDDVAIMSTSFIIDSPSAVDEHELSVPYQSCDRISHLLILFFPPAMEEIGFHLTEPALRVSLK